MSKSRAMTRIRWYPSRRRRSGALGGVGTREGSVWREYAGRGNYRKTGILRYTWNLGRSQKDAVTEKMEALDQDMLRQTESAP